MLNPVMVVTGGANGIGRQIALNAAANGYTVVVADVDKDRGHKVVDSIDASGGTGTFLTVDMADVDSITKMIDSTIEGQGRLDVLVNNAAVTQALGFFDVDPKAWDTFFNINARGSFFAMQYAAKQMSNDGRRAIINIASIAGKGWTGTSNIAYAATKGAVIAMTRVAAAQLGPAGFRVNAVCPGVTETNLLHQVLEKRSNEGGMSVEDQAKELANLSSLRRITQPDDVAAAVLFLASPSACGITGQTVNVDSGLMWD